MNEMKRTLFAAAALFASAAAFAQTSVTDAWVRGTVAGQKATGVFMQIRSTSGGALVSASSPVAGIVEIHEMAMDNNVMRMRAIPKLDLPANRPVDLKPGGYHVMLMDLKQPLAKGQTVPVTLKVQGADGKTETIEVRAEVRDLTAQPASGHGSMKH
jgi:periplasmic copper chaperone A